jgi:hypothetical protein
VAKLLCKCGTVLRDDDPEYGLLLFKRREFDVDVDSILLLGRAREVWRCRTCGRLWVFWEPTGNAVEYVPFDG